jgi:hypothetical protein
MAREQYRDAKLGIADEATTEDDRPDWRAAAWALAKAFPEDYGRTAGAARQGALGMCKPDRAAMGALIEENEELRAPLRSLLP